MVEAAEDVNVLPELDAAVEEVKWARNALPQGGVLLPAGRPAWASHKSFSQRLCAYAPASVSLGSIAREFIEIPAPKGTPPPTIESG